MLLAACCGRARRVRELVLLQASDIMVYLTSWRVLLSTGAALYDPSEMVSTKTGESLTNGGTIRLPAASPLDLPVREELPPLRPPPRRDKTRLALRLRGAQGCHHPQAPRS